MASDSGPLTANRETAKEARDGSSSSRYRFRTDLQIVRNGETDVARSDLTIIDARSGEQHVLTADEFCLCQAADGSNTLAAIRQVFKAGTGREISHGRLFAFFRRLRSLGLLEEAAADGTTDHPAAVAVIAEDIQPVAGTHSGKNANQPAEHDEPLMIAAPGGVRRIVPPAAASTATGIADTPTAADFARSAQLPTEDKGAISPTRPGTAPAEPSDSVPAGLNEDKRRARRRRLMRSHRHADKPTSFQSSKSEAAAKTAEAAKSETAPSAKSEEAPKPEKPASAEGIGADVEDLELPRLAERGKAANRATRSGLRRKRRGAGRAQPGGRRGSSGPAAQGGPPIAVEPEGPGGPGGPVDPSDQDDLEGAFGDGMGAGGIRPMLAGGLEGRALGGGAVHTFLAGMAARARAGAEADAEARSKEPARVSLFNPNAVLGILAALTRPLKYLFVPLLLAVPATIWLAYARREFLIQDIGDFDISVVGTIILGLVITNLISRLTQGTFIRGFGGAVKQFGIALTFGIPRFFVDIGGTTAIDQRGQLWVHAAPLIARLALFCAGTLGWFALRQSAPAPAHLALIVGQLGLLAFLLSAVPLLPSDGYRWLATYFGRPNLRADALASMPGRSSEVVEDDETDPETIDSPPVTFFVVATALAVSLLALVAQAYFDIATTGAVGLFTAALLLGCCIALAAWAIALWNHGGGRAIEAVDPEATQRVLANFTGRADVASDRPVSIGAVGKVFWAAVACALVAVAFLPYRYDPAGTFEILPTERTIVAVRTSGEVEQVLVHEGDWVKANQALAKLSSDDQQREINITRAELDRARAQLAQFGGKAATQESDPGMDALNKSIADAFSDEPDGAGGKNDATATNYTKTQAERAARADVERLTRKLAYARDQLADTTVRAPKDGRVMTPNVHLLTGTWLRRGVELLSLADTRTLEAEIDIPQADIGLVKVGDKVRLRPWSDEDREIAGTVTEIAPAAQSRPYGTVVRVRASIPNEEAALRPAMTGYAKIDSGDHMRVWEAFLGRIIRTVRVEMWSWIP